MAKLPKPNLPRPRNANNLVALLILLLISNSKRTNQELFDPLILLVPVAFGQPAAEETHLGVRGPTNGHHKNSASNLVRFTI